MTIPSATSTAVGGVYSVFNSDPSAVQTVNCPSTKLLSGVTVTSYTVEPFEARSFVWIGANSLQEITASRLDVLSDVDLTTTAPVSGNFLKYDGTNWVPDTVTASVASIDDVGDVDTTTTAPQNGDILEWNGTNWVPVAQSAGATAPTVTVASISSDQTLSTPTDIEEIYVYTPNQTLWVNLASASACGQGFKYQIKNMSTNTLGINANGSDTIDGSSASPNFSLTVQYSSVTLVSDGTSAWYII
jgi:hypothetical protein